MTQQMIKRLLDSCFLAKKITEMMPALPKGLKPRHIHILSSIAERETKGEVVRVGDVSADLNVTMPSVTKLINELAEQSIIEKSTLAEDKRATVLALTHIGRQYYDTYVTRYHGSILTELSTLDESSCEITISAIETLHQAIKKISRRDLSEK